ncbi:holin [Staphylococcus phage vB_SepS_SEP9]|jgi:holin, phage phi LC3 family|uniref:Holin n=2 Tax=Sextaecvirus TaxID=1922243 RepID=W5RV64_9CAUD|nr:holin [Staphylococcus phage vB_SepS_SEP9]YP_009042554.1 holin [Staphylococcus phage 6ec]AHG23949.1 holin [Staphylococcus phage vB_SepS_SEP9]AIA64075.1 putative holin [Staphylococcus phage 6ec]
MSKINWKVRAKKKSFWVAIVSAVALFINNITGAFGLDYSAQVQTGVDIVSTILTLLAGLGIVTDMTTKGIGDSEIAQTYSKPRNSKDPEQYVDWMKNNATDITPERQEKEAEEYDTSKPFTDDSDEVEFDVSDYEHEDIGIHGKSGMHDEKINEKEVDK